METLQTGLFFNQVEFLLVAVASREQLAVVPSRCDLGENSAIWSLYFDLHVLCYIFSPVPGSEIHRGAII